MPNLAEKYFGKYRARVYNIDDPEKRGRVQLIVPAVWGVAPTEYADPAFGISGVGQGFLGVPEVGSAVWCEFEAGDPMRPIWSGGWYAKSTDPLDPRPASEAIQTTPTKVVFKWGENLVEIDRASGSEVIRLTSKGGAILEMDKDGNVTFTVPDGKTFEVEATDIQLGKVAVGFPALRHFVDERLLDLFNNHTHLGNLGAPTSNPQVSIPPTILTSGEGLQAVTTSRTEGN